MKIIPKEIAAFVTRMSVKETKYRKIFWPISPCEILRSCDV